VVREAAGGWQRCASWGPTSYPSSSASARGGGWLAAILLLPRLLFCRSCRREDHRQLIGAAREVVASQR
jgi:hypothetical protein